MRSIKSAQCYISRTILRRQKFFCENRPIFGMARDAEVRGGEEVDLEKRIADLEAELQNQQGNLEKLAAVIAEFVKWTKANIDLIDSVLNIPSGEEKEGKH